MKTITLIAVSLFATSAFAGGGGDKMPPVTLNGINLDNLPPEVVACLKQVDIGKKRVETKKTAVAKLQKKAETAKGPEKTKAQAEVVKESKELERLEGQLRDLSRRLNDAEKKFAEKDDSRYGEVVKDLLKQQAKTEELIGEVKGLKNEIASLDRQLSFVKIGPRIGALAWRSNDRTTYIGGLLGARLTLRAESVDVFVEPFSAFGSQNCPVSLGIKGGVGHEFGNGLSLEGGVFGSAHRINNMLKAKSALLALDLGVGFRPGKSGLSLNLSLLLGAEFDQGTPAFAFGGQATIGWDF